ncbi:energy transducer TonB, partial [Modicisalibacter coralii]|uniref:energy transducer TonB n=1 Tax=Modicisalibacter coralii TaxID=2304602 RepID=UPI001396CCDA
EKAMSVSMVEAQQQQAPASAPASDSQAEASQAPPTDPGVVSSPQPTRKVPPTYPSRAQRRGIEGYVELRFTIRPDGSVDRDSLRVIDAEPRHVFDRAALRAIADWQFKRAPQPREARQRLVFRLEG